MRKFLSAIAFLSFALASQAQQYIPQDENSKVAFSIVNHLLVKSTVNGTLQGLKGSITFNPSDLKNATFDVRVEAGTIKTGIGLRDKDLKKEAFFDADKFPVISISSNKIEKGKLPGSYILYGKLIMKGTSKAIVLTFTTTAIAGGLIFKGDFTLNRLDYTIGEAGKIEDQVIVSLEVHTKKRN